MVLFVRSVAAAFLLSIGIASSVFGDSASSISPSPNANKQTAGFTEKNRRVGLGYYLFAFGPSYHAAKRAWFDSKDETEVSKQAAVLQLAKDKMQFLTKKRFEADLIKLREGQVEPVSALTEGQESEFFNKLQNSGFADGWQSGLSDAESLSHNTLVGKEARAHVQLMTSNNSLEFAAYKCADKIGLDAQTAKELVSPLLMKYERVFPSGPGFGTTNGAP